MQVLIWILCSITLLFSKGVDSHTFSEKMIVSSSKNEDMAKDELLKLKVYFIEHPTTRALQEKYDLHIEIETLDTYYITVIKPIKSLEVRNNLLLALAPMFEDIFFIDYQEDLTMSDKKRERVAVNLPIAKKKKQDSLIDEIGLQWLALLILSVVGLVLSILSRRKIIKIGHGQKDLQGKQNKIEIEIKKLGAEDA